MTGSIVKHTHWLPLADVKRLHRRAHFQYGVSWEERKVEHEVAGEEGRVERRDPHDVGKVRHAPRDAAAGAQERERAEEDPPERGVRAEFGRGPVELAAELWASGRGGGGREGTARRCRCR